MNIDSIKNGIVIDHIRAGLSMDIFAFLNLEDLDAPVKILRKMPSKKIGSYITEINERNNLLQLDNVQGVNSSSNFGETKANKNTIR